MRVAFIPSTFLPWVGGAEIQTHNIANKIVELGHKVDIFLLDEPRISNNNYKIILLNKLLINIVFILKYYLNLEIFSFLKFYFRRVCENKKYDVWHFHSVNYKTLIYIKILKELNQKVFITFQGADIQKDHEIKYGYRFDQKYESFLMEVLKSTNGVFAISENIINDLKFFSYPPEKITKIPNSVEIKKIKNVQKKKTDNQILKIITVARFYEKKKGS